MRVCHWFRSDLRLDDNTALRAASAAADELLPVFVFDPALLESPRQGSARVRFLADCVDRLAASLAERGQRLHVEIGDPAAVLESLQRSHRFDRFTWNRDYSPFAKARDERVRAVLERHGAEVSTHKDRVIFESSEVRTKQGGPFSVYTPYRRAWQRLLEDRLEAKPPPLRLPPPPADGAAPQGADLETLGAGCEIDLPTGGEAAARRLLDRFLDQGAPRYHERRNDLAAEGTSRLSPYLRLGAISPRRCLRQALEAQEERRGCEGTETWIHQLIWRDFYSAVLDVHPRVIRHAYKPELEHVAWHDDTGLFEAWCAGETGFPLVDAGMRELNQTGFMHNRARMVVASFLTKDLLVDWRWGERYFMQKLVDGDPANNNGGWQWAASTGTDAQPYFRIFNPVSQSRKFDPEGEYIRRWVAELRDLQGPAVHEPWQRPLEAGGYPAPIVDHAERRALALDLFKRARAAAGS